jgi:hypothetical protein
MASQNAEKPVVGERAAQFADDALRLIKLTNVLGASGPVADAVAGRAALIAIAAKYNASGTEIVDAARALAWRLREMHPC